MGGALAAVWAAGALACGYWIASAAVGEWRVLLAAVAIVITGGLVARGWYTAPVGSLTWDGDSWHWQSAGYLSGGPPLKLAVALDLQRALWLQLENPAGANLWIWVEKSAAPHRWMDLRRAVVASDGHSALAATSAP